MPGKFTIINLVVSDKGKKSVRVGTVFYDAARVNLLSGELCIDALRDAIAAGTVSTGEGNPKGSFTGKKVVRIAGFLSGPKGSAPAAGGAGGL
jgi:hypothetical protein